jgi:hypothetical protein
MLIKYKNKRTSFKAKSLNITYLRLFDIPNAIFKKKNNMYMCSILNKKKNNIKEDPVFAGNTTDKKDTSKTKPKNPGKFIWFTKLNSKKNEKTGSFPYSPERKKNSLVLNLIRTQSVIKNRRDAVNMWLTNANASTWLEKVPNEKIKKRIKFIWTVVEKATTTLESICIIIFRVVSITPTIAKK